MSKNEIQELINHSHKMAEELLLRQNGEFYPFEVEVDNNGELKHIGHYDGYEFPRSQMKIDDLRKYFKKETEKQTIRVYALTFDCLVKKGADSEKTDAIAIDCCPRENGQRTTYYFTYKQTTSGQLDFGEPWGIKHGLVTPLPSCALFCLIKTQIGW